MEHGPAVEYEEHPDISRFKTRVGIRFFAVYGFFYAGFVLINTFGPQLMKTKIIFGLNLAVTYGFGLILAAVIMGLIYNAVCTRKERTYEEAAAEAAAKAAAKADELNSGKPASKPGASLKGGSSSRPGERPGKGGDAK